MFNDKEKASISVTIRITPSKKEELQELAKREGTTITKVIYKALDLLQKQGQ